MHGDGFDYEAHRDQIRALSRQFGRYAMVGGTAFAIDFALMVLFTEEGGWDPVVSSLVSFYFVSWERLVLTSDCQSMPYSLYRPVGSCTSGLACFASSSGVAIATLTSSHISIVFSYPCILVSFIYIAYIIFIIYIHRRGMMRHATISKQASPRPVSRLVRQIELAARSKSDSQRRTRSRR